MPLHKHTGFDIINTIVILKWYSLGSYRHSSIKGINRYYETQRIINVSTKDRKGFKTDPTQSRPHPRNSIPNDPF